MCRNEVLRFKVVSANHDSWITAVDALFIINHLNRNIIAGELGEGEASAATDADQKSGISLDYSEEDLLALMAADQVNELRRRG